MFRIVSLLLAGLLVCGTAAAQRVTGGASLLLDGKAYRLNGIDAPELEQVCPDGWPAGVEAERYLRELIEGRKVDCTVLAGEHDGLPLALCRADGVDLSSAMVTAGRAFAFVPHSAQYIAQEAAAVRANRGVHAHRCLPPWKWRSQFEEAQ